MKTLTTSALLILAYNRPDKVAGLIDSLRPYKPSPILFGVDGPRASKPGDSEKVNAVLDAIKSIDWTDDVSVLSRSANVGLKKAVIGALKWAFTSHDKLIIIEEDVRIGPGFLPFMNEMLATYEHDDSVAHISGYNVAPISSHDRPESPIRLTRYPESIAWATWRSSWKIFDEDVTWGKRVSIRELRVLTGSTLGAIQWKLNFLDAHSNRISTWAYRWIASMWQHGKFVISPTRNLVTYAGFDEGSHTLTKAPWQELPLEKLPDGNPIAEIDQSAENWQKKVVFGESLFGVLRHFVIILIRALKPEKH